MYRHEVINMQGNLFMSHSRVSDRPSGLVVVEEIARTIPTVLPIERHLGGLVVACSINGSRLGVGLAESAQIVEAIECEGLGEFTHRGIDAWKGLLSRIGEVESVELDLAQDIRWNEKTTSSGLLLPEPPDIEFVGYYAKPNEIEALDAIVQGISRDLSRPDLSQYPGQYL